MKSTERTRKKDRSVPTKLLRIFAAFLHSPAKKKGNENVESSLSGQRKKFQIVEAKAGFGKSRRKSPRSSYQQGRLVEAS